MTDDKHTKRRSWHRIVAGLIWRRRRAALRVPRVRSARVPRGVRDRRWIFSGEKMNALTISEQRDLDGYESTIERGLNTFMEVGAALLAIRDGRLYRALYGTFEEYCQDRWGITQQHATRLIRASETVENLKSEPIGSLPIAESQVRPLTPLAPDDQRLAWQLVTETAPQGKITAAHVQSVVTVLKEVRDTGALDPGTGEMLPFSQAVKAAITEDHYERIKRQETYIAEKMAKKDAEKANPETGSFYDTGHYDYDAPPGKLQVSQLITQAKSHEWYTPSPYVEAARALMGGIDVDPASNDIANETIQATIYYTKETNGLDKDWTGRVWLNPPYKGLASEFIARLIDQYGQGIVSEAVVLVNANSQETNWFAPLWDFILCFADHRINFETQDENDNGSTHGSVFVYLGDNERGFYHHFKPFGNVVKKVYFD